MTYPQFSGHFKLVDSLSNSKWYSWFLANAVWSSDSAVWQASMFSFLEGHILYMYLPYTIANRDQRLPADFFQSLSSVPASGY